MSTPAPRVAAILGVGPGISTSTALKFAREGYHIALLGRDEHKLAPVAAAIAAETPTAEVLTIPNTDVGSQPAVAAAFAAIHARFGAPARVVVFNAAPRPSFKPALELDPEVLKAGLDTTVMGALHVAQAAMPGMIEKGDGVLIFTGATAAVRGGANFADFAVPKFALRGLAQCLARGYQRDGVHVCHVIVDGFVDHPESREKGFIKDNMPLMDPAAVADAYYYLAHQDKSVWTQEMDMRPYDEKNW